MSKALIKLVHVGCRDLGIDEDTRHDLQRSLTGKDSLTDMTEGELKLVVDNLKAKGFKTKNSARPKHKPAPRADLRLIHVLWKKLGEAGELDRPGRAGLNAFVRARFENKWQSVPADVDMLRDWSQINDVVQALMDWGRRAGIDFDWGGKST